MHGWQDSSERHVSADPALTKPLLDGPEGPWPDFGGSASSADSLVTGSFRDQEAGRAHHASAPEAVGRGSANTAQGFVQPTVEAIHQQAAADHSTTLLGEVGSTGSRSADSCKSQQAASSRRQGTRIVPQAASAPPFSRNLLASSSGLLCITANILNAILAMAAVAGLLTHSLALALAQPNQGRRPQAVSVPSCLAPEGAVFTHFITVSLCLFSCCSAATAAIISPTNPVLAKVALWATGVTTAGSFCATITALSFMALAQLGCTALGWVAFGLIIGLGGAAPLIFGGSLMICAGVNSRRRRRRAGVSGLSKQKIKAAARQSVAQQPAIDAKSAAGNPQAGSLDTPRGAGDGSHDTDILGAGEQGQ